MNVYDTELVKAILTKAEYAFTLKIEDADIVMLNTCAIREHAHRKVYGRVHEILHKRREKGEGRGKNSDVIIGILGCMATNLRTDLLENRNLKIDFIAGPDSYKRLPQLIEEACKEEGSGSTSLTTSGKKGEGSKLYDLTLSEFETYSDVFPTPEKGVGAFISVQRGCNNFCTFCVVPYTRGRERSRSPENVVEEVKRLAAEGFKQVTLLGQNVNSYRHEDTDFARLLEAVSRVDGIERIRFTSPHPKDFPQPLLEVIAHNPKVCKQVHLPLQSGSNRILESMNRTYTQEEFLALVEKTRWLIPGVALSTDVIVGFSGETDSDFEETLKVMRQVEFDSAFTFKYSERKQTIASRKHADDVPDAIKTERIVTLNELQKSISLKKNRAHIGAAFEVLIEEESSTKSVDHYIGRTDANKLVVFPAGDYKKGDFISVQITSAGPNSLKGTVVTSSVGAKI